MGVYMVCGLVLAIAFGSLIYFRIADKQEEKKKQQSEH